MIPFDTEKADTFAVGVIMYLLQFRNPCFKDADITKDKNFKELIYNQKLAFHLKNTDASEEYQQLVTSLLAYNSNKRLSLAELDKHPYLNDFKS